MTTASGPDPMGCPCGVADCEAFHLNAAINERRRAGYEISDGEKDRLNGAIDECLSRPSANWQAECARLTTALAEALESISDALAGPDAVRNCDFRSPTVAEVTETATRLRARLETARERIAEATARTGEACPHAHTHRPDAGPDGARKLYCEDCGAMRYDDQWVLPAALRTGGGR